MLRANKLLENACYRPSTIREAEQDAIPHEFLAVTEYSPASLFKIIGELGKSEDILYHQLHTSTIYEIILHVG